MRQARQVSLSLCELRVQHTDCSATEQTTTEQIALLAISLFPHFAIPDSLFWHLFSQMSAKDLATFQSRLQQIRFALYSYQ